jgi:hypothetical protein
VSCCARAASGPVAASPMSETNARAADVPDWRKDLRDEHYRCVSCLVAWMLVITEISGSDLPFHVNL